MTRQPAHSSGTDVQDRLRAIFDRARGSFVDNLAAIEAAVEQLDAGAVDSAAHVAAQRAAHRLAGAAGTVGFPEATQHARTLEAVFTEQPDPADAGLAAAKLADLRRILFPDEAAGIPVPPPLPPATVVAVHAQPDLEAQIREAAATLGWELSRDRPGDRVEAAIIDLGAEDADHVIRAHAQMQPAVPVVAIADTTSLTDRRAASSAGASLVLPRGASAAELVAAAQSLMRQRGGHRFRVLAVDDDPVIRAALPAVLAEDAVDVTTLGDPREFWATLEHTSPDLVVLDLDMPHLDGIELCRVLRTDPRWSAVPIIFLTAHTDAASVEAVFAAGADDYVSKPLVARELQARIRNRLDRVDLYRRLADTDPLTGLVNRRRLEVDFERLSALARRHDQPLSIALLDLDHFKRINDTHGHAIGDVVLRRVADHLTKELRGGDVLARWGGEEIAVAALAMSAADTCSRLTAILDSLQSTPIGLPEGGNASLHVSFSGGVAELGTDGDDLRALIQAADLALYRAKRAGRGRVLTAFDQGVDGSPVGPADGGSADTAVSVEVRDYYATLVERERLVTTGHGRLERVRTQDLLARTLPPTPARVLDVGGGTGVYAAWLAEQGYDVHLIDVVPEHVTEALREGPGFTASVGDARRLEEPTGSADAVLLLGPLYHLLDRADRLQALREARRVLRPGGVLAASVVSRHAGLLAYTTRAEQDPMRRDLALATIADGRHDPQLGFTTAFFHTPEEIATELRQVGFHGLRVRAIEGPMWTSVKTCPDPVRAEALTASAVLCARAVEEDPALLAASAHLLATGHA